MSVRWLRRKHRPGNSRLDRFRDCEKRDTNQLCVVHRLHEWRLENATFSGQRLSLGRLRRFLKALGIKNADGYTWNSVRAPKASALAGAEASLPNIMEMGEWKGPSFLRCVDEDIVDQDAHFRLALDKSDGEA